MKLSGYYASELAELRAELEAVKAERDALKAKISESLVSYKPDGSWSIAGYFLSPDESQLLCDLDAARAWAAAWKKAAKVHKWRESFWHDGLTRWQETCNIFERKMRKWRKRAKQAEKLLLERMVEGE